jgi:hypothetical protein
MMTAAKATDAQILEAVKEHGNKSKAAKALGISKVALGRRYNRLTATVEEPVIPNEQIEHIQVAALEQKVQRLETELMRRDMQGVVVAGPESQVISTSSLWLQAEAENARRIKRAQQKHNFQAETTENEPIAICFASDQHIATGNTVDLRRMREDAELIRDTPNLYVVLGGDSIDNHIKHVIAMLASRDQPSDQWKLFEYYLSIIANKVIVGISGNHDYWTNQIAGVDMLKCLFEKQLIHYAPHSATLHIKVGNVKYIIVCRHQYRYNSTLNLCHTVKRMFDMGSDPFDIGVVCHHHEAAIESFHRHGFERWAARPGSYQIISDYSDNFGFEVTYPTCPTFVLYPNKRDIVGFNDLRKGARFIKSEVEAYKANPKLVF